MSAQPPPPAADHHHSLHATARVEDILRCTRDAIPLARVIDTYPLSRVLAAIDAGCVPCRSLMVRWIGTYGDPWLILVLSGVVVRSARHVVIHRTRASIPTARGVASVLAQAFGPDVAAMLAELSEHRDVDTIAAAIAALDPDQRHDLVRGVVDALAAPPPAAQPPTSLTTLPPRATPR